MSIQSTIEVALSLTRKDISTSTSQRALGIPSFSVNLIEGQDQENELTDDSITTPIAPDLTELSNINLACIYGYYASDDPAAGIVAGQYAPIEIQVNGSGVWVKVTKLFLHSGPITSISYRKTTSDGRTIKVRRIISADGGA